MSNLSPALAALVAKMAASQATKQPAPAQVQPAPLPPRSTGICLNAKQQAAVTKAALGESFVLIGAAGSGKTTTLAQCAIAMLRNMDISSIAMVAFTNTAANNIGRAMSKYPELKHFARTRCSTIHRLLGFRPVQCTVSTEDGGLRDSMRFEPLYDAFNPLSDLKLVVIEEASMLGLDLWKQLRDATPNANYIFVGDLNQIPPVFGDSILGYKLLELEVLELTEIYRQAMDSPIVGFQHKYTLQGIPPGDSLLPKDGPLRFLPLKNFIKDTDAMCRAAAASFKADFEAGTYNPEEDMILIPYNKKFGTTNLNLLLAQFIGQKRNALVHEVIAGFEKHYYAVGDRVRYKKEEYTITEIARNASYRGAEPQEPSVQLTRLGTYKQLTDEVELSLEQEVWDFESMLEHLDGDLGGEDEDKQNAASHTITLRPSVVWEGEQPVDITISTRGEINNMDLGYAMTIHKSQGSEWRKVYLIMTKHHATMVSRELLYTGMTRAREELVVIYSPASNPGKKDSTISKAVSNPRISGRNWQEKKYFFKERWDEYMAKMSGDMDGLTEEDYELLKVADKVLPK